jgi:hypothetical protein
MKIIIIIFIKYEDNNIMGGSGGGGERTVAICGRGIMVLVISFHSSTYPASSGRSNSDLAA